jgi:hypothetical protein
MARPARNRVLRPGNWPRISANGWSFFFSDLRYQFICVSLGSTCNILRHFLAPDHSDSNLSIGSRPLNIFQYAVIFLTIISRSLELIWHQPDWCRSDFSIDGGLISLPRELCDDSDVYALLLLSVRIIPLKTNHHEMSKRRHLSTSMNLLDNKTFIFTHPEEINTKQSLQIHEQFL